MKSDVIFDSRKLLVAGLQQQSRTSGSNSLVIDLVNLGAWWVTDRISDLGHSTHKKWDETCYSHSCTILVRKSKCILIPIPFPFV